MSSRVKITEIIDTFADHIDSYNKIKDGNTKKVAKEFESVVQRIHNLSSSNRNKCVLIEAQLEQWLALSIADYALSLFENGQLNKKPNIRYIAIQENIEKCLNLFKASKDKIDFFEQTADFTEWVIIDEENGISIDFGKFEIKSIDFSFLKYNLYQNYGSTLISKLSSIAIDIYPDGATKITEGINYIRCALQILRHFDDMILRHEQQRNNSQCIESIKLDKYRYRIPRTFFAEWSEVSKLDSINKKCIGLKQYVLDLKCKTYFELTKALIVTGDIEKADEMFDEGIRELIKRSNHGSYFQEEPPDSWWQLIQNAIRFCIKYNKNHKANRIINTILLFFKECDMDSEWITYLLLEKAHCLMYIGDLNGAMVANEQIKSIRFEFEKTIIKTANNNISIIRGIIRKKTDIDDRLNFLKLDVSDESLDFYEWIKRFNTDVCNVVLYDDFWSINNEESNCCPPVEIIEDLMQFILSFLRFEEKRIHKIKLVDLLRSIDGLNDDNKNNDDDNNDDLKIAAQNIKQRDAKILIDFLHFVALSYLHRAKRPKRRWSVEIMKKIAKLAKIKKCETREAVLWCEVGECYKAMRYYQDAIGALTKSAEIAQKINNIEITRNALLTQCEIFILQNNNSSKEELIESYLSSTYDMNKALKYINDNGESYTIKCKYGEKKKHGEKKKEIRLIFEPHSLNNNNNDMSSSDDDEIEILPSKPVKKKQKTKPEKKTTRTFEEDSDDDDDDDAERLLVSRKRKFISSDDNNNNNRYQHRHKKRRLNDNNHNTNNYTNYDNSNNNNNYNDNYNDNDSDTNGTRTDLPVHNEPIMDLSSDSDQDDIETDDEQFDDEEMGNLDNEHITLIYKDEFQAYIEETEGKLKELQEKRMNNNNTSSINDMLKMSKYWVAMADTLCQKATFIKENEPKSFKRRQIEKQCYNKMIENIENVPTYCNEFISKIKKSPNNEATNPKSRNINQQHSLLMLWYFASLDLYGKYLIINKNWNDAVSKYKQYIEQKVVYYKTVHPAVVLHWKYFCISNLAYCYRQKGTYDDRCSAVDWYQRALMELNKLSKLIETLCNNNNYKKIAENVLNKENIARQRAYINIELGHSLDELERWRQAMKCYETAANLARNHNGLIDKQLDAYFNLALTLHHLKDYRRALDIFRIDCRQCVTLCISRFGETRYHIQSFEIERWITNTALQQKQMLCASDSAKRMKDIARNYLSKHTKYIKEAEKYIADCRTKEKYKSQITQFEHRANQKEISIKRRNKYNYDILRRHFALKSYGTILENKNTYLRLIQDMEKDMDAMTGLHVLYMIGTAFKETDQFDHAQPLFESAFSSKFVSSTGYQTTKRKTKFLPQIASSCFEVMEYNNCTPKQRMDILLNGAKYVGDIKDIKDKIEYYQKTLIYHDVFYQKYVESKGLNNNGQSKQIENDIKEIRKRLESLQPQNGRRIKRNTMQTNYRNSYRYKQHRKSSRFHHRKKYNNNIYAAKSTKNQQQSSKSTVSAFGIISHRNNIQRRRERAFNRISHSTNAQKQFRTSAARQFTGFTEKDHPQEIEKAIQEIKNILTNYPTMSVKTELNNILLLYQDILSKSKQNLIQKQVEKQKKELNPYKIVNGNSNYRSIRNNSIGIIHEEYEWIYKNEYASNQWKRFNSNEAKQIEDAYQNKLKSISFHRPQEIIKIKFNMIGTYKSGIMQRAITRDTEKLYVIRRVLLKPLHKNKISGWTNIWLKDDIHSNEIKYTLNKHRDTMEFASIEALMKMRGMSAGLEIHRIERIQNIATQTRYNKCTISDNQLLLFHGTKPSCIDGIIEEGFDFRLHGDNGTKYGNGSYFGVYASYAAQFCNQSRVDPIIGRMVKYMFICAVKAGSYCLGSQELRRPPQTKDGKGRYDSVVDNIQNPSIFVTFDNAQSLPLYLITFTFDEYE